MLVYQRVCLRYMSPFRTSNIETCHFWGQDGESDNPKTFASWILPNFPSYPPTVILNNVNPGLINGRLFFLGCFSRFFWDFFPFSGGRKEGSAKDDIIIINIIIKIDIIMNLIIHYPFAPPALFGPLAGIMWNHFSKEVPKPSVNGLDGHFFWGCCVSFFVTTTRAISTSKSTTTLIMLFKD